MDQGQEAASNDFGGLLDTLDEADAALRALYRKLADNPDLAGEYEAGLKELHAKRLELAQRVGLAMLAQRRAPSVAIEASTPPLVPASVDATVEAPPTPPAPTFDPAEPEAPPPERASDAEIAEWTSNVRTSGLGSGLRTAPSRSTAWTLVLHELMEAIGSPRDVGTTIGVIEEIEALDGVATPERQALWARLSKHAQQLWLSMLVARTRVLKEIPSSAAETKGRVKVIIGRYPAWANAHTPGHVNGLQVKHLPLHGSWAQDARHHWGALNELLGDELVVRPSSAPKRKAKREQCDDDDDAPDIDPNWPVFRLVRGRTTVVVGGDPREPNRQRLERAFQLASLDWPPIDGPRKVDAVVGRIRSGSYGLALVLQPFVAHKAAEPIIAAAKSAGVPWALVEGYGVASVKLGLERFLGRPQSGVSLHDANADRDTGSSR